VAPDYYYTQYFEKMAAEREVLASKDAPQHPQQTMQKKLQLHFEQIMIIK